MALLKILRYPDERLHRVAAKVPEVTDETRTLVHNMAETMYAAPGIGLAATQVDVHQRVIVIDVSDTHDQLQVLINPEITWSSDEKREHEEGCLSLPEYFAEVVRPEAIRVKFIDRDGAEQELEADGILATCIQHEMDHLRGILFVDHVSAIKRGIILRKLKKAKKLAAA